MSVNLDELQEWLGNMQGEREALAQAVDALLRGISTDADDAFVEGLAERLLNRRLELLDELMVVDSALRALRDQPPPREPSDVMSVPLFESTEPSRA